MASSDQYLYFYDMSRLVDFHKGDPSYPLLRVFAEGESYELALLHTAEQTHIHGTERKGRFQKEHFHDVYHIVLYTRGRNVFLMNGAPRPCAPGTLALTGPGEPHDFLPGRPGEITYFEITFELRAPDGERRMTLPFPSVLSFYAGETLGAAEFPMQLSPRQLRILQRLMEHFLVQTEQTAGRESFARTRALLDVFAFLIQEIFGPERRGDDTNDGPLTRAKAEIEARYNEDLSVPELARLAHFSVGHFSRAFKARFGLSPMAHLRDVRVRAAQTLLRTTQLSSKEIAGRVGFVDIHHFTKAFKKAVGLPPRRFRASREHL